MINNQKTATRTNASMTCYFQCPHPKTGWLSISRKAKK